ncbi:MAG: Gx transporter family protein [Oscillospiraceae bacterium]|jgi:heptaprenyl diphosphate synthase|nr:Gx transporter family protein [Oscillospiraceae bacterium]
MPLRIDRTAKTSGRPPAAWAAYCGLLAALAVTLSWAEQLLAPLLQLPLGAKPGLSNIAVMLAASVLGLPAALAVALVKALFAGVTRGLTALLLSGGGGLCSALLVGAFLRVRRRHLSEIGIGMLGGVTHNLAQFALAAALMQGFAVFLAAPALLFFGLLSGAVTGLLLQFIQRYLRK